MEPKTEAKPTIGNVRETDKRIIHRYAMILKEMGIARADLAGTTPTEAIQIIHSRIEEFKAEKTDMEILANEGEEVTLAGKVYEIKPATIDKDLEWRKQCGRIAGDVATQLVQFTTMRQEIMKGLPELPNRETATEGEIEAALAVREKAYQAETTKRMTEVFQEMLPYLMGEGLDKIIALLFLYSDELKADREKIMAESSSYEIVTAAMAGMRVAFPFVVTLAQGLMAGVNMFQKAGLVRIPKA